MLDSVDRLRSFGKLKMCPITIGSRRAPPSFPDKANQRCPYFAHLARVHCARVEIKLRKRSRALNRTQRATVGPRSSVRLLRHIQIRAPEYFEESTDGAEASGFGRERFLPRC